MGSFIVWVCKANKPAAQTRQNCPEGMIVFGLGRFMTEVTGLRIARRRR